MVGSHYISGFEQISHVSAAFSRDKPLDSFLSARNLHSLQLWISNGRRADFGPPSSPSRLSSRFFGFSWRRFAPDPVKSWARPAAIKRSALTASSRPPIGNIFQCRDCVAQRLGGGPFRFQSQFPESLLAMPAGRCPRTSARGGSVCRYSAGTIRADRIARGALDRWRLSFGGASQSRGRIRRT